MFTAKCLLIVYHSYTGGAAQMAQAVFTSAQQEPQVQARLLHATTAQPQDVIAAHGYVFVTPEYLAGISGIMKDFFDRCYYPALEHIQGRPYATLICAGSDGSNAARQIQRIATGWRLKAVCEPIIICTHAQSPEAISASKQIPSDALNTCRELGAAFASGLQQGIF